MYYLLKTKGVVMEKYIEPTVLDSMLDFKANDSTYLDKINSLIDWKKVKSILDKKYRWTKNTSGSRAYSPLLLFKILLVQSWEKLSDPQAEFALKDRLSVIRFVGVSVSGEVPDHSTISRFRSRLLELEIFDELFSEINRQLSESNLIVKSRKEAIIDATLVESSCRPRKVVNDIAEDRHEGDDDNDSSCGGSGGNNESNISYSKDTDASWLKKGNRAYYGYKQFFCVNSDGYILGEMVKSARESEVRNLAPLLQKLNLPKGTAIYADKGYSSESNRKDISGTYADMIMYKAARNKPLTGFQKFHNKAVSKVRYVVEQAIGLIKLHFGYTRSRFIGIDKVRLELSIHCMAYNLRKGALRMI
ncbi:IS5 family transposase [Flexistipes sinusarabici]|nr:IS5 family transposase [Flexistipes sinusarabici]